MTVQHYELGAGASLLDRTTLRVFNWWRRAGRDLFSAYFLTQLTLATVLAVPLTAVPNVGPWQAIGAAVAVVAPVAAWLAHRRRYSWSRPKMNPRARTWGITMGVLLFLVSGVFVMVGVGYIGVLISMLAPQGPLALLPAIGTGAVGWIAATIRKRQLDDPIYP